MKLGEVWLAADRSEGEHRVGVRALELVELALHLRRMNEHWRNLDAVAAQSPVYASWMVDGSVIAPARRVVKPPRPVVWPAGARIRSAHE